MTPCLSSVGKVRVDYLLREQDFGLFTEIYDHAERKQKFPDEFEKWARLRSNSGKFYARPPDGEKPRRCGAADAAVSANNYA